MRAYAIMAQPMKTLGLHYPMVQFFKNNRLFLNCPLLPCQKIFYFCFFTTTHTFIQGHSEQQTKILNKFTVSNNNNDKRSKKVQGDLRKPPGLY